MEIKPGELETYLSDNQCHILSLIEHIGLAYDTLVCKTKVWDTCKAYTIEELKN